MNKQYPTSGKARATTGWHKHLDKTEKRRANRGTRVAAKDEIAHDRDEGLPTSTGNRFGIPK